MVRFLLRDEEWIIDQEDEDCITLQEAMAEIGIGSEVVVAMRGGEFLQPDAVLHGDDVIRLMPLIAGG